MTLTNQILKFPLTLLGAFSLHLLCWLVINGITISDSTLLVLVITLQTSIGIAVVQALFRRKFSSIGLVGVGFATGTLVTTILDQIGIALGLPSPFYAIIFFASSLLLLLLQQRSRLGPGTLSVDEIRMLLFSPIAVVLGVGLAFGWWSLGTAVIAVALVLTFNVRIAGSPIAVCLTATVGLALFIFSAVLQRLTSTGYGAWVYRPLYTGSDDQIFSASLGWSLAHFGPNEYAAAVGSSIRYHWFSLAWSGVTERLAHAEPLVVTLHVVPVITLSAIAWLLCELVRQLGGDHRARFLTCLTLFGTAVAIDPSRFVYVMNTSNITPFIWILLLLLALIADLNEELRLRYVVIPVIVGVILMSKAPFGVAAISGLMLVAATQQPGKRLRQWKLSICVAVTGLVCYLVFLSPHVWEQRKFSILWNWGGIGIGSRLYPLLPVALISLVFVTIFVGGVLIQPKKLSNAQRSILAFVFGASALGILRFILSGGSAELYFFNVSVFCGSLVAGIGFIHLLENVEREEHRSLSVIGVVCFMLMTANLRLGLLTRFDYGDSFQIVAPLLIGFTAVGIFGFFFWRRRAQPLRVLAAVLASSTLFSSGAILLNSTSKPENYADAAAVASLDEIDALDWLRSNSSNDALIATNRSLCDPTIQCEIDESRFLISAFAQRRVLIEGPRFVVGGKPFPQWVLDRINASLRFASDPSPKNAGPLKDYGVTWFYFLRDSSNRSYKSVLLEGVGEVMFENDTVAIIKLIQ